MKSLSMSLTIACGALSFALVACDGRTPVSETDQGFTGDGQQRPVTEGGVVIADGSGPDDGGQPPPMDLMPPDLLAPKPDSGPKAALESVLTKLTLPASATDYARDIDGNGTPDNALGGLMGFVVGFEPIQPAVDEALRGGDLLLLFELFAPSLTDTPQATVAVNVGEDGDSDASNNQSLDTLLKRNPQSARNITLSGSIVGAKVTAVGDLLVPFTLGITPIFLTVTKAQLEATTDSKGMTEGVLTGAIPWSDITDKIVPQIAEMITQSGNATAIGMLDGNGDRKVTSQEILNNFLVSLVLRPDLDLDGDGQPDHMSTGFGFETTRCVIAH